jgi:Zn/Cd-binding protein ZinT
MNPALAYFASSQMDTQTLPTMQHSPGQWQSIYPFKQTGQHTWSVELKELNQNQATDFEKKIGAYRSHIQQIQKELAQSGLSLAEKTELEAQLNQDKQVLRQIEQTFEASMSPVESDSLAITVTAAR